MLAGEVFVRPNIISVESIEEINPSSISIEGSSSSIAEDNDPLCYHRPKDPSSLPSLHMDRLPR